MKKFLIIVGVIVAILTAGVLMTGCTAVGVYNSVQTKDQAVVKNWGQVENQYQRRYDLIPNLVETVKGYAKFEKETFVGVSQARASVGSLKIDPGQVPNQEQINQFAAQQQSLGTALSRLMMIQEKYPELKAEKGFQDLRAELAGTENRITVARMDFNESVERYNVTIKTFPNNLLAGLFNFQSKAYFKAEEAAKQAPKVNFN